MSLSSYSFRTGYEFLARGDLENMMTSVFQDLVLFSIWHTTLPISIGPYTKVLLQINCTFLLAAHKAVSSANWDFVFCCGEDLKSLTYIRKSNGLRTELCETPAISLVSIWTFCAFRCSSWLFLARFGFSSSDVRCCFSLLFVAFCCFSLLFVACRCSFWLFTALDIDHLP